VTACSSTTTTRHSSRPAIDTGYRGVTIMREKQPPDSATAITSLDELLLIVAGAEHER
jgi:hypothetical protein